VVECLWAFGHVGFFRFPGSKHLSQSTGGTSMSTEYFSAARIIKQVRAARIAGLPLSSMGDEQFVHLNSEKEQCEILGPMPGCDIPAKKSLVPSGMPAYLSSLYEAPLLTREQEAHLFRKMNYLKYLARKLRETLDLDRPESHYVTAWHLRGVHSEVSRSPSQRLSCNGRSAKPIDDIRGMETSRRAARPPLGRTLRHFRPGQTMPIAGGLLFGVLPKLPNLLKSTY
jgi:hypothetical protein